MSYTYSDTIVGDLYKDAHGFRPGSDFWQQWSISTPEQKQSIWDGLSQELRDSEVQQAAREAAAIQKFEVIIANILKTIQGSTREDAIRYLHDAYQTNGDANYLEYLTGVPYGYLSGRNVG